MKVLCVTVTIALHLSSVLGQNLQGTETLLQRELAERMEEAPLGNMLTEDYDRELGHVEKAYGSEFHYPKYTGFCRSPGNKHGHYETYHGFSEKECKKKCAEYNTFHKHGVGAVCTAYEYHKHTEKCEIHFERIVSVKKTNDYIKCVGANDMGCKIASYYEMFFSHGNPGYSYCRVGKTKGEYKICHECKSLYKCFSKCKDDHKCVAFEYSENDGGRCELHTKYPTGVAKTKKKAFCYVQRKHYFDACH